METDLYEAPHQEYRATARAFVQREVVPNLQRWDAERHVDRETWKKAGQAGLVGLAVPERFGGASGVQRIYGGTNEIMKEIIRRDLIRS